MYQFLSLHATTELEHDDRITLIWSNTVKCAIETQPNRCGKSETFHQLQWKDVNTQHVHARTKTHTNTHTVPSMPFLLWDTPWCIPRTQRTGSWPQAWCWAVLSPWRSPAEALYAPLWVDPQGWAQPYNLKLKAPTVDYGKYAPAELSREGLWWTPTSLAKCASS